MPALSGLKQRASRTLLSACTSLAAKLPQAFLDAAVVPLLSGGGINAHQRDALTRLMKECYKGAAAEQVVSKMLAAVQIASGGGGGGGGGSASLGAGGVATAATNYHTAAGVALDRKGDGGAVWSDELVQVVHGLLQGCPPLSDGIVALLVTHLAAQAALKAGSLKYATFVILLVNKYQRQLYQCRPQLETIVEHHTTFLKRTLSAALAKMK